MQISVELQKKIIKIHGRIKISDFFSFVYFSI